MADIEKFIKDLKENMKYMTRSDLQACVEAYCMQTGEDEEKILEMLDKYRKDKKQIIKK